MNFIEWLRIIFIGLVEGITEWLPISSTGHMILVDSIWKTSAEAVITPQFWNVFLYVIQLGAILAVVTLYFNKLNPFSPRKSATEKKETWRMWFMVIIGCLPAGIVGVLFDSVVEEYLSSPFVIAMTLIVYGILFILVEKRNKKIRPTINKISDLTIQTVLIIGFAQILAMIPGTSRSGITIISALVIGCSRFVAAEYTFFLAIPVMVGMSLLKIGKYLLDGNIFTMTQLLILLVGSLVAYITSVIAIKTLMQYIKKHDFTIFGVYRIALGLVVFLAILVGIIV